MLFFKKSAPKMSESEALVRARHGREIKYITRRDNATYTETILAQDGVINIVDNELVILCANEEVLRVRADSVKAYELMNLSGINLVANGQSYIAYYTKGIENK